MPEAVRCNLCGADDALPLFSLRDYRLQVDDVLWSAVRCRRCGLGYLNPRPTASELARYYPSAYFSRRRAHRARHERQAAYVPGRGGRLLDVGTAGGDFLVVMKERGWRVEGVEPFTHAGGAEGITIHRAPFPGAPGLSDGAFDVITAWAVFEHLPDPGAAFERCAGLLRSGGRLIVQVPNLRSIYARWAMQEDVPRHLYFFTPATLRAYGRRVGLELVRVHHTTDLFGGSGRGVLRLALVRATRRSVDDFFEILRARRRDRFRRWPLLATAWTATAAVERVLLSDWLVRTLRISGQIVVEFEKPGRAHSGPRGA